MYGLTSIRKVDLREDFTRRALFSRLPATAYIVGVCVFYGLMRKPKHESHAMTKRQRSVAWRGCVIADTVASLLLPHVNCGVRRCGSLILAFSRSALDMSPCLATMQALVGGVTG